MNLVIIGNGVAGIGAAFSARERSGRDAITVISGESDYFFSRTALMYAFMDRLGRRDLEPYERAVYAQKRIDLVRGRVADLDAEKKQLRLDGGNGRDTIEYDRLLLATGSAPRPLAAPGLDGTSGVVHFVSLADLDACERFTPSTRSAVVVGGGLIGVELVECLRHHGVAVIFLVREPWYWPAALGREEAEMVTAHLREHGVDVVLEEQLAAVERDGSGRVSAVMTDRERRLPCELLGIAVGVQPAIDWLRTVRTPPALGRGIAVDPELRTSLPDVWAAGDCAEIHFPGEARPLVEQIWYSARRQGELAGINLTGGRRPYRPPLFFNSAKFFEVEYTTVGDVARLPAGARALYRRDARRPISQRIVVAGGRVVGFNMLGSRWDHALLARWIDESRDLEWVAAHLPEAQFDVEFGRVDLAGMKESELVY